VLRRCEDIRSLLERVRRAGWFARSRREAGKDENWMRIQVGWWGGLRWIAIYCRAVALDGIAERCGFEAPAIVGCDFRVADGKSPGGISS
jgi:hypothetical protein